MAKGARSRRSRGSGLVSVSSPNSDSESVRIRKISNGYLILREGAKRGKYFSHEEFSAQRPQILAAPASAARKAVPKSEHGGRS